MEHVEIGGSITFRLDCRLVGAAPQRFDDNLQLADETTRELVARHLGRLRD